VIVGHQKQWQFLKKSAELNRISHAYLFFGPSRVGKRKVALEFAKLLDCQGENFLDRPCQQCSSCQAIEKGIHPDLLLIEPKKREIQISQIRDLSWKLSFKPYSAPFKIAIIDESHCLNSEAQSCFLKTLEEPKGKTVLILISEYPDFLFQTILSRVQKIRFSSISKFEIEDYLKNQGISQQKAQEIAFLSLGKPGLAIDFLLDQRKMEDQNQKIKELEKILDDDLVSKFQYVKDLISQNQDLKEILEIWIRYFRRNLLAKAKGSFQVRQYSLFEIKKAIQAIEGIKFLIETTNINQRLALEKLMLEL